MGLEEDFRELRDLLLGHTEPPHWVHQLHEKLDRIETLVKRGFEETQEKIMGLVTLDEDTFLTFITDVQTQATALTAAAGAMTDAAGTISTAAGVLGGYIQQLLANQAVPIPAGDLAAMQAAQSALDSGVSTLTNASGAVATAGAAVTALEPVTPVSPTPVSPTPVSPTPVSPTPVSPTPVSPTPVSPTPVSPTPVSPTPVSPTPVSPTPVSPAPAGPPVPVDATQLPVQAGTLDPSTNVVEVPQGVVPVVVSVGAVATTAGALPPDAWVTPVA